MIGPRLYLLQRLSALVMAPLVIGHLATMIVAIQGGLSAAEILSRTQGSLLWALFYGAFVLAAATHAAIGLRVVAGETLGLRGAWSCRFGWAVFSLLLLMGLNAVWTVTGAAP